MALNALALIEEVLKRFRDFDQEMQMQTARHRIRVVCVVTAL